ncbi:MAG: CBS domain-containing protein [Actinobacteria bacterium]|nr:CBS domain-containing protein [Actinomycetota bacterium]
MNDRAADVMIEGFITVEPTTPVERFSSLLRSLSCVIVVEAGGRAIGVVSAREIVDAPPGSTARDVMRAPVFVQRRSFLATAARRIARSRDDVVIVADDDIPVGIVPARSLLARFARDDADVRDEIARDIIAGLLWPTVSQGSVRVEVKDGIVRLDGWLERRSSIPVLRQMIFGVAGVAGVEDDLSFAHDDTPFRPRLVS